LAYNQAVTSPGFARLSIRLDLVQWSAPCFRDGTS